MSNKYKFHGSDMPHFVTLTVVEWIDVFSRQCYRDILMDSLSYCITNKGLILHAWVIMTNHAHLIVKARPNYELSAIFRDLKKFTAKQIFKAIEENTLESRQAWLLYMFKREGARNKNNEHFQFWQQDNHPVELSTPQMLKERLNYLHQNPVRAGMVRVPEDYLYSSAGEYELDKKGLIEIEKISW